MKIRNAAGQNPGAENTFIAVDELENRLGSCRVEVTEYQELLPERPLDVRLSAEGDESALMSLMGTALTRGMMLARKSGLNARIYAECDPQNKERMALYRSLGFLDDDAMVRMSRRVESGPNVARLPEGCVEVEDDLSDAQERAFFLERQRQLFQRENADKWLEKISKKPCLRRFLLVAREGLVGEALCWAEQGRGVVGMVYTSPQWRRKGVGVRLMEAARLHFYRCRLMDSYVDVRLIMRPAVKMAATAGYRLEKVLCRLPGINLDAKDGQRPRIG